MVVIDNESEFHVVNGEYMEAMKKSRTWELSVYEKYDGHESLHIMSMIAYMKNKHRGFSDCNDETHYNYIRNTDIYDILFEEATKGFELSKKYMSLGPAIWKWNAEKECKNSLFPRKKRIGTK
jgi:hypothetical protein